MSQEKGLRDAQLGHDDISSIVWDSIEYKEKKLANLKASGKKTL